MIKNVFTAEGIVLKKRLHIPTAKKGRKRAVNEAGWQKNLRKEAFNKGVEFTPLGKLRKAEKREMKESCGSTCRFQCDEKITFEERKKMYDLFWSLGNHEREWDFILRFTSDKVSNNDSDNDTKRIYKEYTLNSNGQRVVVCKTMFMNTLSVSNSWLKTTSQKFRNDLPMTDRRGTTSIRKMNSAIKTSITEHINLFPRVESHYNRKNSSREYLEGNLNVSAMHRLYITWAKENGMQLFNTKLLIFKYIISKNFLNFIDIFVY